MHAGQPRRARNAELTRDARRVHRRAGERSREAEVGDLDDAVGADQDVARLEVAVDEPGAVRGREPGARLTDHREDLRGRARPGLQPAVERVAGDELHREEHAVAAPADVEDLDDVRVRDLRHRLRLAAQPRLELVVALVEAHVRVDELDHDRAA